MTTESPHPYPSAEHYTPPTSQVGFLREFMRQYASGMDSLQGAKGLGALYYDQPFVQSMQQYARMLTAMLSMQNREFTSTNPDLNFYVGSVLATHSYLRAFPQTVRVSALRYDQLAPYKQGGSHVFTIDQLKAQVDQLAAWHTYGYKERFGAEQPYYREAIEDLILHVYDGSSDIDAPEKFLSGFMLAVSQIEDMWSTGSVRIPPGFLQPPV